MENMTDLKEVLTSNQCKCDCHQQVDLLLQNALKDKKEIREQELKLAKLEGLVDKIKDKDQTIAAMQWSIDLYKNINEPHSSEYKAKLSQYEATIKENQEQLDKLQALIKEKDNLINKMQLANDKYTVHKSRLEATFYFTVKNVSKLKSQLLSPPFYMRMLPWKIKVIPNDRALGFFLQCNGDKNSPTWSCKATAEFRLKSHKPGALPYTRDLVNHLFCLKEDDFGYSNFITWQELQDPDKSYVLNESINLEVHVKALPSNIVL